MDRRTFAVRSLAACSVSSLKTLTIGHHRETSKKETLADSLEFRAGEAIQLELKSTPVKWQGGDVHLLSLHQFTFALDSNSGRLTARAKGSLLTFDDVDYTVGVTVFAGNGSMLGASTAVCQVPRIWLGIYAQQPVDLMLDFGISNNYTRAQRFLACISERTVLTPDQWQTG